LQTHADAVADSISANEEERSVLFAELLAAMNVSGVEDTAIGLVV
jgi:hypothetical protein